MELSHKKSDRGFVYNMMSKSANTIMATAENQEKQLEALIDLLCKAVENNRKFLICGNGGSATQSQHVAAELVGRFKKERKAFPAIALTADMAIVTSLGNDYGFDSIFSRQVEAYGGNGDILMVFSTSGKSPNIIHALRMAREKGMNTVSFVGNHEDDVRDYSDIVIGVPSNDTALIQDVHSVLCHVICGSVELKIAPQTR